MKIITTLLILIASTFSFAQTISKDTSVSFIANWSKGEEKVIEIVRTKKTSRSGKPAPPFNFSYEAHVSILDSSKEGYTIKWVFHLTDKFKEENPLLAMSMPVYEGLKMIFTTTSVGSFKELINWQEVKDAYTSMMEQSIPKNISDSTRIIINKSNELFNSRAMVEGALIKEIQLYYAPYGGEFTSQGIKVGTSMGNPFGGEPMPAITVQLLVESNADSYTAFFSQELDSTGMDIMMKSMLKKFDIPLDSFKENEKNMLSSFQMKDSNQYKLQKSTGWISELTNERTAMMADTKQTEIFSFKLK
ncbi:MAG TPA: hypothetical protein VF487_06745 [Chitinophagaceae bacterium]